MSEAIFVILSRTHLKNVFWPPAFWRDWCRVSNPRLTTVCLRFSTH